MADIDNLTIKITADCGKAISALKRLETALENVNKALSRLDSDKLDSIAASAERVNNSASGMKETAKAMETFANSATKASKKMAQMGDSTDNASKHADGAKSKFSKLAEVFKGFGQLGGERGSGGLKKFSKGMKSLGGVLDKSTSFMGMLGKAAKGTFKALIAPATLAAKGIRRLGRDNSATAKTARTLSKEFFRVSKMLKLMITRMILRKIITGVVDGFKNLTQYSSRVNASMSLLWNSFRQLGNSIAAAVSPLLNAFAPALNYIIQLVIKAVNAINQLISALTGMKSWTKAKTLTDSYADSLDKSNKKAKELKKTVLGFDELNQLQDNNSSGGGGTSPADMFEDVPIEDKWEDLANKLKSIWNQIIGPIKKAWAALGKEVLAAWSGAFKSIGTLISDIGRDFLKVWNDPRTLTLLKTMLLIFKDIGGIVKYLADGLDKAWNTNNLGLKILRNIRDLFLVIATHIRNITFATMMWAKELNFTPLLEAFEGWLDSLKPVVDNIAGVFEDFYTTVLLPLAKWSIEKGLPELIQVFTDFNDKVDWAGLREKLQSLWDHLEPFAETVGEGFIKFVDDAATKLADFLNSETLDNLITKMNEFMDSVTAEDVESALWGIANALVAIKGASIVGTILATVASALGQISTIVSNWGIIATLGEIGMVLAGLGIAVKEFIDMWIDGWDGMSTAMQAVGIALATIGVILVAGLTGGAALIAAAIGVVVFAISQIAIVIHDNWDAISQFFKDLWNSIVSVFSAAVGWVKSNVIDPILALNEAFKTRVNAIFQGIWILIKAVWITVSGWWKQHVIDPIVNLWRAAWNMVFSIASALWAKIKQVFAPFVNWFNTKILTPLKSIFSSVIKTILGFWTGLFNAIVSGAKAAANGIVGVFERAVNGIIDGINGFLGLFNKAVTWAASITGDSWTGVELISHISLPRFAGGGFPKENGLFMANSSEMLGKFSNGKTAVANNEQITQGIAQAVFAAITSANAQSGGNVPVQTTIQIDGQTIARAVTKGQRNLDRRYSPVMA